MSTFPNSPRLLKGGIVLLDAESGIVQHIITLQYNPDTLTRMLSMQGSHKEGTVARDLLCQTRNRCLVDSALALKSGNK